MKITVSFTGVISTGEFENERPTFGLEEEFDAGLTEIQDRQDQLYQACRTMFERAEQQSLVKKVQKLKKNVRFYPYEGMQFPSVTSIIGWDYEADDDAKHKAVRGTIIHTQIENYIKTKEWKDATKIPECYNDVMMLKQINKMYGKTLAYDDINFLAFLEKYPLEFISSETIVVNPTVRYAGRQDIKCKYDGKITICDIKTGNQNADSQFRAFKQGTFYWHCPENNDVEQFMIIPLDGSTKQGFSKPLILDDKDKYWDACLKDREKFKQLFGV